MAQTRLDQTGKILTVNELTLNIKNLLETDRSLQNILVRGEISNLTLHSSGHIYFSLKDESSQIQCVMFKGNAFALGFSPKHGDRVVVKASVAVYPVKGNYQLMVAEMKRDGMGDLHRRFLELKDKLEKEGLFREERKRPIPKFPKKIGIVTSLTGAALRDMLNTIRRRFPCVQVIIAPAVVQGGEGANSIMSGIKLLNDDAKDVDTIIIARGGGSLEDLWCFNEESVARTICDSKIPVISGVGHETDFTIADFAADLRAPTPSIAAERAVPVRDDLLRMLDILKGKLSKAATGMVAVQKQSLDMAAEQLFSATRFMLSEKKARLERLKAKLEALDPEAVMRRGYSITLKHSKAVKSANDVLEGDEIETLVLDGSISSVVKRKDKCKAMRD